MMNRLPFRQVFNIIFMLAHSGPLRKARPVKTQQAEKSNHHSWGFEVPKILSFSNRLAHQRKQSQLDYTNKSTDVYHSRKSGVQVKQHKIQVLTKEKISKKDLLSKTIQPKMIKISLIASRKSARYAGKQDPVVQSRFSARSLPEQMVQLPNHISAGNFVESISCDFFSNCNDLSGIDQGERKPISYTTNNDKQFIKNADSHAKLSSNRRAIDISLMDNHQSIGLSGKNFKRKNIFDISISQPLNSTMERSFNKAERSRSRNSIFKPREKSTGKAGDSSLSQRKKIFSEKGQNSPRFGVKCIDQTLEQSDIPKNILESWQKFSESNESWSQNSFGGALGIVKEAGLEQSQAQLMR